MAEPEIVPAAQTYRTPMPPGARPGGGWIQPWGTPGKPAPKRAGMGRPKGALNRASKPIRLEAQRLLNDPEYKKQLLQRLRKGTNPEIEKLLYFYAYGKPVERVAMTGPDGQQQTYDVRRLSVDELQALWVILKKAAPAGLLPAPPSPIQEES
jgi:hypothetical protein